MAQISTPPAPQTPPSGRIPRHRRKRGERLWDKVHDRVPGPGEARLDSYSAGARVALHTLRLVLPDAEAQGILDAALTVAANRYRTKGYTIPLGTHPPAQLQAKDVYQVLRWRLGETAVDTQRVTLLLAQTGEQTGEQAQMQGPEGGGGVSDVS